MPIRARDIAAAAGASVGLSKKRLARRRYTTGIADYLSSNVDYIKEHGLIGGIPGSFMQAGKDIGASYNAYLDPTLRAGSSVILQPLFGQTAPPAVVAPKPIVRPTKVKPMGSMPYNPNAMGDTTMQAKPAPTPQQMAPQPAPQQGNWSVQYSYPPGPTKEVEIPFEDQPRPYGASAPTGMEGARAMEQKKQRSIDALIAALGEIGASVMGPYQESWQARLGRAASGLAKQRVFAGAMEQALAGEIPEHTEILTPEQQIQISQAIIQKQAMGLEKQRVETEKARAATHEKEVTQAGATREKQVALDERKLAEDVRQFDLTWPTQKAESEARAGQYKAYADNIATKMGVTDADQAAKDLAFEKTDKYMSNIKDLSPEEFATEWQRVYHVFLSMEIEKLGATAPIGARGYIFNKKTGKFERK